MVLVHFYCTSFFFFLTVLWSNVHLRKEQKRHVFLFPCVTSSDIPFLCYGGTEFKWHFLSHGWGDKVNLSFVGLPASSVSPMNLAQIADNMIWEFCIVGVCSTRRRHTPTWDQPEILNKRKLIDILLTSRIFCWLPDFFQICRALIILVCLF